MAWLYRWLACLQMVVVVWLLGRWAAYREAWPQCEPMQDIARLLPRAMCGNR